MKLVDRAVVAARDRIGWRLRRASAAAAYTVGDTDDAEELALFVGSFTFEVPTRLAMWPGAFAYGGEWHPYVRALRIGREELDRFYDGYQPATLAERYALDPAPGLDGPPLGDVPWLQREAFGDPRTPALHREEMRKYCGPATGDLIEREWGRLSAVYESVKEHGYRPDRHEGHIRGYFLRDGDRQVFLVAAGQHRAATLAALGWERLPVAFQPGFPRVVRSSEVHAFPLVRTGRMPAEAALAVFRSYFERDGSQQYGRAAAGPSRPPA